MGTLGGGPLQGAGVITPDTIKDMLPWGEEANDGPIGLLQKWVVKKVAKQFVNLFSGYDGQITELGLSQPVEDTILPVTEEALDSIASGVGAAKLAYDLVSFSGAALVCLSEDSGS